MAYIYKITNDINQKIYIGKTEFSIEKRFKEHCEDAFRERNEKRPLYAAMRKYGTEHFHISLVEITSNPSEREQYWIQYYNSYHHGYNATLGGDGKKYIDYNAVVKSYQQTKSMKQTALDLKISPDSVSDILHSLNIDTYQKPKNAIKTNMYSLKGEYLRTFDSVLDAGNYLIKNNLSHCKPTTIRTHISEVCRGKRQTAAGFKWKFAE